MLYTFSDASLIQESYSTLTCMSLTFGRFHILENHSCTVSRVCNKLDYVGVLILMWAAGVATIFYGFVCDHKLRLLYCATVCVPPPLDPVIGI